MFGTRLGFEPTTFGLKVCHFCLCRKISQPYVKRFQILTTRPVYMIITTRHFNESIKLTCCFMTSERRFSNEKRHSVDAITLNINLNAIIYRQIKYV